MKFNLKKMDFKQSNNEKSSTLPTLFYNKKSNENNN